MYPSNEARQLSILLRTSRDLDVVGDVTASVDNPSELIAWAAILDSPRILAWRAADSGRRFLTVTARHRREPIRGQVAAVLDGDQHRHFWDELLPHDLSPGSEHSLTPKDVSAAWAAMPVTPPS